MAGTANRKKQTGYDSCSIGQLDFRLDNYRVAVVIILVIKKIKIPRLGDFLCSPFPRAPQRAPLVIASHVSGVAILFCHCEVVRTPDRGNPVIINVPRSGQHLRFVFYSNGQADVYSYVPVLSLYSVFAGAYIMHAPDGDVTKQLAAVPADV